MVVTGARTRHTGEVTELAALFEPAADPVALDRRLVRLAAELEEEGVPVLRDVAEPVSVLEELAYALRPPAHERRVPTYGAIVIPAGTANRWAEATGVDVRLMGAGDLEPGFARQFADGMSTFALRCPGGITHLACFDRSLVDEYLLVSLQEVAGGVVVQRHPGGQVRVFGPTGVVRWDGISWYHDPPTGHWVDVLTSHDRRLDHDLAALLVRFAVHELSARRIGATLVWRPDGSPPPPLGGLHERLPHPPAFSVGKKGQLAALRQVLSQVDGATVIGPDGVVTAVGVRLVPSPAAEAAVSGTLGGMRHMSALRYSHDDPAAVVIVVSEDGPVTMCRAGRVLATGTEMMCRLDTADSAP